MSQIRYDRLHNSHTIIAPNRINNPLEFSKIATLDTCPFCEGNEHLTPSEIYATSNDLSRKLNSTNWQSRVVPNLYRALELESSNEFDSGFFEHSDGFGVHEVIIDTSKHKTSMLEWSYKDSNIWLSTIKQRVADLMQDYRLKSITVFKNEGKNASASMSHSHTQLIAMPIVPINEYKNYEIQKSHFLSHKKTLLSTIIQKELELKSRIVAHLDDFILYAPYASSYAFEFIIASIDEHMNITNIGDDKIEIVSKLLLDNLAKLRELLGDFSFNINVSTPYIFDRDSNFKQFYIRVMPRIYGIGGFESATGIMINPIAPEEVAKKLATF